MRLLNGTTKISNGMGSMGACLKLHEKEGNTVGLWGNQLNAVEMLGGWSARTAGLCVLLALSGLGYGL